MLYSRLPLLYNSGGVLSTEFHLISENVFSIPLRWKILHKMLSLVCQLLSLSLLHFGGKAIETVV